MDFDRNHFLTDVLEKLVSLPGDSVRQLDHAVNEVVEAHAKVLRELAQRHRTELVEMAEERRRTGQPVATKWKV